MDLRFWRDPIVAVTTDGVNSCGVLRRQLHPPRQKRRDRRKRSEHGQPANIRRHKRQPPTEDRAERNIPDTLIPAGGCRDPTQPFPSVS
jgi:hypothetical protein